MPPTYGCGFWCRDYSKCVPASSRCDGVRDCLDGSDEARCCIKTKRKSSYLAYFSSGTLHSCQAGFVACRGSGKCIPKHSKCDGVIDCSDMSDESHCCDDAVAHRTSASHQRQTPGKTRLDAYLQEIKRNLNSSWRYDRYDGDPFDIPQRSFYPTTTFKLPNFDKMWHDNIGSFTVRPPAYVDPGATNPPDSDYQLSSGGISGLAVVGFFLLALMLAVCRCFVSRKMARIQSQHPSSSSQSLIGQVSSDASRHNSPVTARRENVMSRPTVVIRSAADARSQRRTVLVRTRSTNDLHSSDGRQATSAGRAGASSQQQQQQQQRQAAENNEHARRTTDALHLMVRDGPWLTTRTLRPMIPDQPNIPLFIEESSVRRLDDRRGIVVATPPQLMMYVDGEFVWIPASRVPDALNYIALLSLQTEEGPSPAAAHHIEHLPTVSVQQQTVETGGRCNVCLEDFNIDEQVRQLPCHHLYHSDCIVPWLQLNGTCPACREPISRDQQTDNTTGAATTDETR